MMRLLPLALAFLVSTANAAPTVGDRWERSLLEKKHNGTLPGPRPGQKCLWSKKLNGCLWYTPGRWWGIP
jgi:hypothetical protein